MSEEDSKVYRHQFTGLYNDFICHKQHGEDDADDKSVVTVSRHSGPFINEWAAVISVMASSFELVTTGFRVSAPDEDPFADGAFSTGK